jgi:hypothetical protein
VRFTHLVSNLMVRGGVGQCDKQSNSTAGIHRVELRVMASRGAHEPVGAFLARSLAAGWHWGKVSWSARWANASNSRPQQFRRHYSLYFHSPALAFAALCCFFHCTFDPASGFGLANASHYSSVAPWTCRKTNQLKTYFIILGGIFDFRISPCTLLAAD